jgi:hypothetical protein
MNACKLSNYQRVFSCPVTKPISNNLILCLVPSLQHPSHNWCKILPFVNQGYNRAFFILDTNNIGSLHGNENHTLPYGDLLQWPIFFLLVIHFIQ